MAETDREMLELAAKAAGIAIDPIDAAHEPENWFCWNPLMDDGDALRLAVKLGLLIGSHPGPDGETWAQFYRLDEEGWRTFKEPHGNDEYAATRRAITRAAAELARAQGEKQ